MSEQSEIKSARSKTSVLFTGDGCQECGSRNLTWHAGTKNYGGCVDGRIRTHEVSTIFFLGCEECSHTLLVVDGDKVAAMLTEMQEANGQTGAFDLREIVQ